MGCSRRTNIGEGLTGGRHTNGMCDDEANPAQRQAQVGIAVSTATDIAKSAAGIGLLMTGHAVITPLFMVLLLVTSRLSDHVSHHGSRPVITPNRTCGGSAGRRQPQRHLDCSQTPLFLPRSGQAAGGPALTAWGSFKAAGRLRACHRFRPIAITDTEVAFCVLLERLAPLWDAK
jgi:hypothetical protein